MKKRVLSMLMALALCLTLLPAAVWAEEADTHTHAGTGDPVYTVNADTTVQSEETEDEPLQLYANSADLSLNGAGTESNPYLITSVADLEVFRDAVKGGEAAICARLMSDLDLGEVTDWTPIAYYWSGYCGIFDGNNYTIKASKWTTGQGLFGTIDGGTVKNLNFTVNNVTAIDGGSLLCNENYGTIEQCTVTALIGNNQLTESGSFGVFAGTNKIGPLDNEKGLIKNCLAVLMSDFRDVCGFAVTNDGTIENSLCAIVETNVPNIKSVYAIEKTLTNKGTSENCYCTLYNLSIGEPLDGYSVEKSYSLSRTETERASIIKQIAWKLNNGNDTEGSNTDPWRYGGDVGFNSDYYPTLNPTDAKVTKSDGSETETPHTHRVDGVIREFVEIPSNLLTMNKGDGGCYYLERNCSIWNDPWAVPDDMTLCLDGHSFEIGQDGTINVPAGKTFTVTDCSETAGEITVDTSYPGTNITGVTVKKGGTFVLDNVSVTGCATGIDFQGGTVKLSGSAKVTGNTDANIKLTPGNELTFGILDKTARLGVTYAGDIAEGDEAAEVAITDKTGLPYARQIMSDNGELIVSAGEDAVVLTRPAAHKHCICGADHKEITYTDVDGNKQTAHTAQDETVFQPWDPYSHQDAKGNPTLPETAGSYYLTQSVELPGNPAWQPNGAVNLCLNGMTVTFTHVNQENPEAHDNGLVWLDDAADHLTVTDCGSTGTLKMADGVTRRNCIRILNGAAFSLYAGTMTNFARAVSIGNVRAYDNDDGSAAGTFTMYGGTLTGNISGSPNSTGLGSAVSANGENAHVILYDGKIINNKTAGAENRKRYGGGVYVENSGSFTMYGGEISGNGKADESQQGDEYRKYGAKYGGGVYVNGSFTMTGGKISSNTVTEGYGGGVCVAGSFTMTGGEISDNTVTKGFGGGVYLRNTGTSARMENAVIRGNSIQEHGKYNYYGGGGGGVYYTSTVNVALTLKNTTISGNTLNMYFGNSQGYGGGAGVYGDADITIEDCTISGNKLTGMNKKEPLVGAFGGAGVCVPASNLTIKDSQITGNTAISDAKATTDQKLVSGGVYFCNICSASSERTFTVSGKVEISGNTADGAAANVYLEKAHFSDSKQATITAGTLTADSSIGVTARTAPTDSTPVTVVQASGDDVTIPTGVFTSDNKTYKAVLSDDSKEVTLTVNQDVAEVTHQGKTTGYETLAAAIKAAQSGDTVTVLTSCGLSEAVTLNGITLELNGKTVTATVTATVEAKAAISLSEPATIQNGTINGNVSGGSALILCSGGSLELKNITIKESAAKQAVAIGRGSLFMDSGTIDGGLQIGAQASLVELSGGTFKNSKGGSAITGTAVGLASYLKSGYAYQMDDQPVDLSKETETEGGKTFTVAKCESHAFEQGKCKYCDFVCKHETVDEKTRECSTCGAKMAARVYLNSDKPFSETPIYVWYITLEEAFASIKPGEGLPKVSYYENQTLTEDVEISGNVVCYADNKAELSFDNGKSFVVKDGGRLQLAGRGYTGAVTVESGGEFIIQEEDNSVGTLTVYGGSKLFDGESLLYGHFDKIVITNGDETLADLIPSTRTLRRDDNSWATDEELKEQSIENVTVVQKPFYGEKLTIDSGTQEYTGSNEAVMRVTFQKAPSDSATYTWYEVYNGTEFPLTSKPRDTSEYTNDISGVGMYTYVCYVECDGYKRRTNDVTCRITPATAKYTTEPKANTLTYNGSAQELVTAGTTKDGKVMYSTDEQRTWSETVPTGMAAIQYTVYYKIIGDDNHTNSEVKQIDVKIDPRPVAVTWSGTDGLVYDGNAKTVTASVSNVVNGENVTLTLNGAAATDAGNYTAAVTALGGTDAGNYTLTGGKDIEKVWTIAAATDNTVSTPVITGWTYGDAPNAPTAMATYGTPTFQYSNAKDGTYENTVPTDAGTWWVKAVAAGTTNYNAAKSDPVQFMISKKDITGAAVGAFDLTYTGKEQQPAATVTIDGLTVTGSWSSVTNVADKTTFTATGNFTGTITDVETKMQPKDMGDAVIIPTNSLTYTGQVQTQEVAVTLAGFTSPTFTVSGNTATDVKAEGNYTLTITGTGNFGGTKTLDWNLAPIAPTENPAKKTTATVRRGRALSSASITKGEWFALDGVTVLDGTYSWVDGSQVMDADGNAQIVFHPASANYSDVTFEVAVTTYVSSGGGSVSAYSVTVDQAANGTVAASAKSAGKGDAVTITVTPDKGYALETLTVLDKNGKEVALTDKGGGKYTFTMPAGDVTVKATFMEDSSMLNFFVDVKAGDYFYDAVKWAAEKGITSGTDAAHFSPNAPCTRAQIVTFLWRAAGFPEPKGTGSFVDVPADSYYAKAVTWAMENGITGGTGDGKFSPNATCTREQAVTFLYRASGSPAVSGGSAFRDVAADAYYADAVAWAEKNGVTGGIGGGLFGSGNDCTRAQIVTFLYRSYLSK